VVSAGAFPGEAGQGDGSELGMAQLKMKKKKKAPGEYQWVVGFRPPRPNVPRSIRVWFTQLFPPVATVETDPRNKARRDSLCAARLASIEPRSPEALRLV
jgi:hypothetical protein